MENNLREETARSVASFVAGLILGLGRLAYGVLSMIFSILVSIAG